LLNVVGDQIEIVHAEADKPAEEHAIVDLLHQKSLAADGI